MSHAAQSLGGPKLAVDTDMIDFGKVPFDRVVKTRFRLRNVENKPLQLLPSPPVEVVEGC